MKSGQTASWCRQVVAVFRHEWRSLIYSPLTGVFQAGFLLALAICVFLIADFYSTDEATSRTLLLFLPWISMIFVPALAMRAFTDGSGGNAIELLLTLPLRVSAIVIGKYLAGSALFVITLCMTFPFVITLFFLGEPDPGAIIASYLAATLLVTSFYAVALLAAALTRDYISAFIGGLVALFILNLSGWDVINRLGGSHTVGYWRDAINYISPKTWLDSLSRGVFDVAGVGYFVLLTALTLLAAGVLVNARRRRSVSSPSWIQRTAFGLVGLLTLVIVMPLLTKIPVSLDVTSEREYTIHTGTHQVLANVPPATQIELHWSESNAQIPVNIRTHARRIKDLLHNMARANETGLTVNTIDPQPDTDEELKTLAAGISRVPMSSGDHFYFGASLSSGNKTVAIPYFDPRRARMSEYDIAVALQSLARSQTPRVGILSPLLAPSTAHQDRPGMSFMTELRKTYDLAVIPYFAGNLPEGIDVLVLIHPVVLQKSMLYAIDQYLMGGGRMIVMLDPHVRFDSGVNQGRFEPSADINDLSDLLLAYGIEFIPDQIVGDRLLAAQVGSADGQSLNYPYWLRVPGAQLSKSHPVTASVNELLLAEAGELSLQDHAQHTVLISTGPRSGTISHARIQRHPPEQLSREFKDEEKRRVVATVSRGPFDSAYSDPPVQMPEDEHARKSPADAQLFVVADSDWVFDPFSVQRIDTGGEAIVRPLNDNLAFLLNMIEYLSGDPALLSIRSRGQVHRPFTRVAELFRDAQDQYREEETRLTSQLQALEQSLVDPNQAPTGTELQQRERQLLPVRKALRETRRRIRESVQALGQMLTLINLLAGPVLAGLFCWFVRRRRVVAPSGLTDAAHE